MAALLPQLQEQAIAFREGFNTPGMALAVVTRDNVYPLTSGYCTEGKSRPIRTSTRFQFASVSKPITATFAAMLVSQGLLSWDDRISDLLPGFEFADASATQLTTVRDMLNQRSGLPGSSGIFWKASACRRRPFSTKCATFTQRRISARSGSTRISASRSAASRRQPSRARIFRERSGSCSCAPLA